MRQLAHITLRYKTLTSTEPTGLMKRTKLTILCAFPDCPRQGSPADAASLRAAGASTAKALVFLAKNARPVKTAQATGEQGKKCRASLLPVHGDMFKLR